MLFEIDGAAAVKKCPLSRAFFLVLTG